MKLSAIPMMLGALLMAATLRADPSVSSMLLNYNVGYTQTDGSTVSLVSNPYTFQANIDGSSMTVGSPLTSAELNWQNSASQDQHQSLSFQDHGNGTGNWQWQSSGYADQTSFLNAFPGTSPGFTFGYQKTGNVLMGTANLSFTPSYAVNLNTPQVLTTTNGTWSDGVFHVADVNQAVTFTFNDAFAGTPDGQQVYHYDGSLDGNTAQHVSDLNGFLNVDPTGQTTPTLGDGSIPSFTIAAGSLVTGESYTFEINYAYIMTMNQVSDLGANAAALLQRHTSITRLLKKSDVV